MKVHNLFYLLIFTFNFLSCVTTKNAIKDFNNAEYFNAANKFEKTLKSGDAKNNFLLAESLRKSNRLWQAEKFYRDAIKNGIDDEMAYYYLVLSLKANNNYEQADSLINNYLKKGEDESVISLLRKEAIYINNLKNYPDTSYYRVKNLKAINTKFAEYSPSFSNEKLYFVSNRQSEKIYSGTGTPFTDLYEIKSRGANVDINSLKKLEDNINQEKVNEGSITFSEDGTYMIFAKGNDGKSSGRNNVDLYWSRFRRGGWTNPRLLNVNTSRSWDSTPFLSKDGKTLYFASNRAKGYGGTDIYKANVNRRGRWINIQNMGPEINTSGNELFPSVTEDGRLYFSSDSHEGFGGLDIFVASRRGGKITIVNPGKPLNSRGDDFGVNPYNPTRGFFTSNREGGAGDDDIYTFVNDDPNLKIVNYTLKGTTLTPKSDTKELNVLGNSTVKLLDREGQVIEETFTDSDGNFKFIVYSDEEYILIGEKENYFSTRGEFSTIGKELDKSKLKEFITNVEYEKNLILDRIIVNKSIVLDNIYYDLDKSDIREDAAVELDKLIVILRDNPNISIELSSHTDDRASVDYNQNLSQRRAESAVSYILSKGIDDNRITARGYGESQLIILNAETEDEHQINRRTEFKVTSYEFIDTSNSEDEEDKFFNNNQN
ncbi:MAG: OmpA family protein [Bacteroidota bacterium]|nr:OmpA family protein [Bacteroidota bacterium]